jgi:hypothetical protein
MVLRSQLLRPEGLDDLFLVFDELRHFVGRTGKRYEADVGNAVAVTARTDLNGQESVVLLPDLDRVHPEQRLPTPQATLRTRLVPQLDQVQAIERMRLATMIKAGTRRAPT